MSGNSAFYLKTPPDELQQGDICFAPIARLESQPLPIRHAWEVIDEIEVRISDGEDGQAPLSVKVGYGPVMVISHDCQMDKEMNNLYHKLRRENPKLSKADALKQVEADPNLDRFITVAPILTLSQFRTDDVQIKSGGTIGCFYLPATANKIIAVDSAVDLMYAATIDRHLLENRSVSLSEESRARLRLEIARLYALRTPEIGFEVERAVGQKIVGLHRDPTSPSEIIFDLQDGSEMRLILKPEAPRPSRPSVRAPKKK